MSTCRELRAKGRQALGNGMFTNKWLMAILAMLVINAISCLSTVFIVVPFIIMGAISVGTSKYFLDLQDEKKDFKFTSIFFGFTHSFGRNFGMGLYYVFLITCLIVGFVSLIVAVGASLVLIPLLIVIVPLWWIALYLFIAKYSMMFFVLADHPEYTGWQARYVAITMIHGYRWKYIKLSLSFIGWSLVASFTCGIGNLWLTPYMQSTFAAFYKELKAIKGIDTEKSSEL